MILDGVGPRRIKRCSILHKIEASDGEGLLVAG